MKQAAYRFFQTELGYVRKEYRLDYIRTDRYMVADIYAQNVYTRYAVEVETRYNKKTTLNKSMQIKSHIIGFYSCLVLPLEVRFEGLVDDLVGLFDRLLFYCPEQDSIVLNSWINPWSYPRDPRELGNNHRIINMTGQ
jgi:hypothetical protein